MQHVEGQSLKLNQDAMTSATKMGGIQSNFATASGSKVVLFLFQPKFVPNFARRPLQYRFGDEFIGDLMDAAVQESAGVRRPDASFMREYSSASSAVLPRSSADVVDLREFGQYWTFVLIVDNNQLETCFNTHAPIASRLIYTGWVMDEAASHAHGGGVVINPRAVLNVTSFVKLAQNSNCLGPAGAISSVSVNDNRMLADPTLLQRTEQDGQALYNLNPHSLANAVQSFDGSSDNYNTSSVLHFTPLAAVNGAGNFSMPISTSLGNPFYHISHLVSGLAGAITSERLAKSTEYAYDWNQIDSGNILHTASHAWRDPAVVAFDAPDPQKAHTIGELDRQYPYMDVQVLWQPHDPTYELSDPMAPTRRNVFTSVVASSLPYLLNELGIIDVSFRYDSHDPNSLLASADDPGVWYLTSIALSYTTDVNETNLAWMKLLDRMRWSIFRILKDNVGDFSLTVQCSPLGSTLVDLKFLDEFKTDSGFVEINGALCGINAVTVGNHADATANASQLASIGKMLDVQVASEGEMAYANLSNGFSSTYPLTINQTTTAAQPQTGQFVGLANPDGSKLIF